LQCPMTAPAGKVRRFQAIRPWGSLVDPSPQQPHFFVAQAASLFRHEHVLRNPGDKLDEPAFRAFSREDRRSRTAALKRDGLHIQAQIAFLFFRSVAGITMPGKDRLDVAREVHGPRGGRRQFVLHGVGSVRRSGDAKEDRGGRQQWEVAPSHNSSDELLAGYLLSIAGQNNRKGGANNPPFGGLAGLFHLNGLPL